MSDSIKIKSLIKKNYSNGAIIRVRMVNFLTYDDCEVFPGPKLNVVIGPNGAGKSTLTHAICLACGGSPQHVGRSPELKQFVKRDKVDMDCYVEIDLLHTKTNHPTIHTIKRQLKSSSNSSIWQLNNKKSSEKDIKDFLKTFKIDVSNLCSFMPQDKVGSFSRKTPKELLQDTLKSIEFDCDKNLYDEQVRLSNFENDKAENTRMKESKERIIKQIETEIADLKGEVDRIQLRNESLKKIEYYEIKRLILLANEHKSKKEQLLLEKSEVEKELHEKSSVLEPYENDLRNTNRFISNYTSEIERNQNDIKKIEKKLNELKEECNELDIGVDDLSKQIEQIETLKEKQTLKLQELSQQKNHIENDLITINNNIPVIKTDIDNCTMQISQLNLLQDSFDKELYDLKQSLDSKQNQLVNVTKNLNNLQDEKQIFRNKIEKLNLSIKKNDLFQTMDFIESNKNRFHKNIFGPIAYEISVNNPACAIMLEKAISMKQLLLTFITLDEQDSKILKNELVGQRNIRIDVITMSNLTMEGSPYPSDIVSRYQHIGLQGFLIDQIQCPEEVKCYLSMFLQLQTVLFAVFNKSNGTINDRDIQSLSTDKGLRLYVNYTTNSSSSSSHNIEIVEYNGTKSKYGDKVLSLSDTQVIGKGILGINNNNNDMITQKNNYIKEIKLLKENIDVINSDVSKKYSDLEKIRNDISNITMNKQILNKKLKIPNELTTKLNLINNNIKTIQDNLNKDNIIEKQNKLKKYINLINEFFNTISKINEKSQEIIVINIKNINYNEIKNLLLENVQIIKNNLSIKKQELETLTRKLSLINNNIKEVTIESNKYFNDLENLHKKLGQIEFDKTLEIVMSICKENTIDEINEQISIIELNIKRIIDNPQVIIRYEELSKKIINERLEYDNILNMYNNSNQIFEENSKNWLDKVTNLCYKLDIRFNIYMRKLNFYGNVRLIATNKLSDYEIKLLVSFRNESDLVELSGLRHSGGERAVSTIMYLMALQDMTASPFRVVDEINQGMDERNERLVLDRIVQNCCSLNPSGYNPQYFLVTPKLLPGLKSLDNDNVRVLVIFNGPGAMIDMDIDAIIKDTSQKYSDFFDNLSIDSIDESDDEVEVVDTLSQISTNKTIGRKRLPIFDDDDEEV